MKDVAAIVLAAGRSRRMGQFKPLLPFGNRTVVDHCIDNLRRGGVDTIVAVVGHRAADIQSHLRLDDASFAVNPEPDSEMSVSVACGVSRVPVKAKAILITPVDHPAVPSTVVARIIEEWKTGKAGLVVPTWNGRGGHPVLVDASFRNELLHLNPKRGLRHLFESHPSQVTRLAVDSPYIARDMDTWDDYVLLHKDVFGVLPRHSFGLPELEQHRAPESN